MSLRLWPRSLLGQMLLAVGLALLVAQAISTVLLFRAQELRREYALVSAAAFRLAYDEHSDDSHEGDRFRSREHEQNGERPLRSLRIQQSDTAPIAADALRDTAREEALLEILEEQGIEPHAVRVTMRRVGTDPYSFELFSRRKGPGSNPDFLERPILIASMQLQPNGGWTTARVPVPQREARAIGGMIAQTAIIYLILVGGLALLLRRITRPLAALTRRMEHFADTRQADGQLAPEGPEDTQRLIEAHNRMEDRISALLNEKDVMLGAIGHDLKTPLAALRVRIESVEDETERARMARTIEDITRSLDDILSLARVGRPTDPLEPTELSALCSTVVEEYEDMGQPVELGDTTRIVLPVRTTWLRRALRNLIGNALRYGERAQVSLSREGQQAVIRIEDHGPGIENGDIDRMLEPFTRGDPSRNKGTGGAGLGLTLAKAIAQQHGGQLILANRTAGDGSILGLVAELRLPLPAG